MGHYTTFQFDVELANPPEQVQLIISYLVGWPRTYNSPTARRLAEEMGGHEFFETEGWSETLLGRAIYGRRDPQSFFEYQTAGINPDCPTKYWELFVHSEVKNFNHKIQKFLDWIKPYMIVSKDDPQLLGYMLDDTGRHWAPTLIYLAGVPKANSRETELVYVEPSEMDTLRVGGQVKRTREERETVQ